MTKSLLKFLHCMYSTWDGAASGFLEEFAGLHAMLKTSTVSLFTIIDSELLSWSLGQLCYHWTLAISFATAVGRVRLSQVLLLAPVSDFLLATITELFSTAAPEETQICKVPQMSSRSATRAARHSAHSTAEVCQLWCLCQGVVEDHTFTAGVVPTGPCEDHRQG